MSVICFCRGFALRFIGVSVKAGCLQGESWLYTVSVIVMQIKLVVIVVVIVRDVFKTQQDDRQA